MKAITCVLTMTRISFLAGQAGSCQRPDVAADVRVSACAVVTANGLQSRVLLLASMFSPYG